MMPMRSTLAQPPFLFSALCRFGCTYYIPFLPFLKGEIFIMEHYLRFRPLRGFMDALGMRVLLLFLAVGWFTWLWGLSLPSLLAGGALAMLLSLALRRGQAKWTTRQEAALRRRLGGEMFLEDLLFCPEAQAHLTCALLLCRRWALVVEDIIPGGVICRQEGVKLLISCLRLAPEESLTAGALLPFARAVREAEAVRGVLCVTGQISPAAVAFVQTLPVPLRLVDGGMLAALGGEASPATDAQLVTLGQRRQRIPLHAVADTVLHPAKCRRYLACGGMLMALYVITRLRWYPIPALVCFLLAGLCRFRPRLPEKL